MRPTGYVQRLVGGCGAALLSGILLSPLGTPLTAEAATLSLTVSGNQLIDGSGIPIQFRGVNRSGTEYACIQGWGIFDGPSDAASVQAIAAWHVNAVRVLLNEDCWLGINGVSPNYGGTAYQQAIESYVSLLHQSGMYAELSLVWAAPGSYQATYQPAAPDADHSVAFWSSVASAFKNDPAVMFGIWGETTVSWSCFKNGCADEATYGPSNTFYATAGTQQLVNAIRSAGATQPIAVPCIEYANDCADASGTWLQDEPTDPLHQLVAEAHIYGLQTCADPTCFSATLLPTAKTVPMIWGEAGESFDGSDCGSSVVATNLPWAMTNTAGVEAWTWDTWSSCDALINTYTGAPTAGYGQWMEGYYASLATPPQWLTATTHPAGKPPVPSNSWLRVASQSRLVPSVPPVSVTPASTWLRRIP